MNILDALAYLYPQAKPEVDFTLRDDSDGLGPYIEHWHLADPQPTREQLEQAWLAVVNAPPSVPQQVTMRQARQALLAAGLLQTVNDTIAAMTGDAGEYARIEWEFSGVVERNRPLVQSLAPLLNLSDAQLDNLFIQAAQL